MKGGWSGTPDTTVDPSGGAVGLIQQNTIEGSRPLDNPSEMLTKALLLLLLLNIFKYLYDGCSALTLGCWVCCGKSPTNNIRDLTSLLCITKKKELPHILSLVECYHHPVFEPECLHGVVEGLVELSLTGKLCCGSYQDAQIQRWVHYSGGI